MKPGDPIVTAADDGDDPETLPGLLYGTSWSITELDEEREEGPFATYRRCVHTVAQKNAFVLEVVADDEYCGGVICAECALEQIKTKLGK